MAGTERSVSKPEQTLETNASPSALHLQAYDYSAPFRNFVHSAAEAIKSALPHVEFTCSSTFDPESPKVRLYTRNGSTHRTPGSREVGPTLIIESGGCMDRWEPY